MKESLVNLRRGNSFSLAHRAIFAGLEPKVKKVNQADKPGGKDSTTKKQTPPEPLNGRNVLFAICTVL